MTVYLRSLQLQRVGSLPNEYPFTVPVIAALDRIEFHAPITFFAGENATGKSTLLEAIAFAARSIPVRTNDTLTEKTLEPLDRLAEKLTLRWNRKPHAGFFLRAEDFMEYKKQLVHMIEDFDTIVSDFKHTFTGNARTLAQAPALGQKRALIERYGEDLNARSHGEGFLHFFQARFTGPGLYLLDEPDTAMSSQSVLGLLSLLGDLVGQGAQFIIATHSPILLAYPGAMLLSFDRYPITEVTYEELEQVALLRSFLNQPDVFLHHLFGDSLEERSYDPLP